MLGVTFVKGIYNKFGIAPNKILMNICWIKKSEIENCSTNFNALEIKWSIYYSK